MGQTKNICTSLCYDSKNREDKSIIRQIDFENLSESDKKSVLKDAAINHGLKHPNIVKLNEIYKTKNGRINIVSEYCNEGSLSQKIANKNSQESQVWTHGEIISIFAQICVAV